jgi:integrase
VLPVHELSTPSRSKRVRVAPNLWQRTKDGRFEDIRVSSATGRQQLRTLKARTLTEAKREQRALAVAIDHGEDVAPSKKTFREIAEEDLALVRSQVAAGEKSARTHEKYHGDLARHILPALGHRPIQKVTASVISAFLNQKREEGLSAWSRVGMMTPLRRIFGLAMTRGYIATNPLHRLARGEMPRGRNLSEARTLSREELAAPHRTHADELSADHRDPRPDGDADPGSARIVWRDVDFENGVVRLRYQLTRATKSEPARRVRLKTNKARRDIRLEPELASLLRRYKLASQYSRDEDYVFATETGSPLYYRNVATRGLDKAAERAGLNRDGLSRLSFHDLRHTYGSHLIRQGLDVVRVSKQLGHARSSITLDVYAHEIEETQHGDGVSVALSGAFGGVL